jgi:uncharacterized protein YgbK (DUF1537 family)
MMEKLSLGFIADDYTGASDLANTLGENGLKTIQTIGVPAAGLKLPEVDAIVVALKSRSVPAERAVAWSLAADRWLRDHGAGHVMFKICSTFDSTDNGNIGPVTEALQDAHDGTPVLVTPAFPETRRTVYLGHLFVGLDRLDESPLKDHPLNPMRDSNLVRTLARQSRRPVGLIPLSVVTLGDEAIKQEIQSFRTKGTSVAVVDAVFESDLQAIGRVALTHAVSTGASGLGLGLARAVTGLVRRPRTADSRKPEVGGAVAIVAGSCSKATLDQIAAVEGKIPILRLDPDRLISNRREVEEILSWAEQRLPDGPILIASSAPPKVVQQIKERHAGEQIDHLIEEALATIAEGLVARGVRRLILAGGETSGATVDRLKIPAFLIREEIAPGVPIVETLDFPGGPLLMALKSGNFGDANFFLKALSMIR